MERNPQCEFTIVVVKNGLRLWLLKNPLGKNSPTVRETWVRSLGREDPLEKGKAAGCSILAWRIPWTIQSMGKQRVKRGIYRDSVCVYAKPLQWLAALCDPMDLARQAPLSMGFSRQEYWSGLSCPPPGDLPSPRMEPESISSLALATSLPTSSTTWRSPTEARRVAKAEMSWRLSPLFIFKILCFSVFPLNSGCWWH